ncbi:MBOAT family O-acyltransferase [Winogradskyella luteola]|uniref:MBOAT family protein n=1 Tax=Winogradskyella luteola TaxID=2828330 RepID=A0A9X1F7H9_9FLAO|nr:MBOAT family O-acyltransferase [Winogradskyella luteola]MBV7268551.1 MBOAT family protein [Winogradskyella luteola]
MLFNTFTFFLFFITVFFLYWFLLKKRRVSQNILLLIASYVFYGWWDWRFLSLIVISTIVDFAIGKLIFNTTDKKRRKVLLVISLLVNLGFLGFFKYYNFFIENWILAWESFGISMNLSSLQIILPVGISFYTFQTLSYTIDIYRKKIEPTDSILSFATFVAFFPQLVAGPIERAQHLLPQFLRERKFSYKHALSGIHIFIWGLFKKVVIADTCATYVDVIFQDYGSMSTLTLMLGAVYFAFQIYGDFSGYSDMAIGLARMLGFDLMQNFKYPYFARDIAEFWRRWHISLTTWFRDYLYIPLGGSRTTLALQVRNVFIIFLVSGFWHGANWTFIAWGFLNAIYFLPLLLLKRNRVNKDNIEIVNVGQGIKTGFKILATFTITCFSWVFFRADNIQHALDYIMRMVSNKNFGIQFLSIERYNIELIAILGVFIAIEWFHRKHEHPFTGKFYLAKIILILFLTIVLGVFSNHEDFIYFQF